MSHTTTTSPCPCSSPASPAPVDLPSLRATARAAAERLYRAGPGRAGDACPRVKKARSAYMSRFQAREYEALLRARVEKAEGEVGELRRTARLMEEEKRALQWEAARTENLVLRKEVERLRREAGEGCRGGRGRKGEGAGEVTVGEDEGNVDGAFVRMSSGKSLAGDSDWSVDTEVWVRGEKNEQLDVDDVGQLWGMDGGVVKEQPGVDVAGAGAEKKNGGSVLASEVVVDAQQVVQWGAYEAMMQARTATHHPWA